MPEEFPPKSVKLTTAGRPWLERSNALVRGASFAADRRAILGADAVLGLVRNRCKGVATLALPGPVLHASVGEVAEAGVEVLTEAGLVESKGVYLIHSI